MILIFQDGIWIAGSPRSRWDPPRPRKKFEKPEKSPELLSAIAGLISIIQRLADGIIIIIYNDDSPTKLSTRVLKALRSLFSSFSKPIFTTQISLDQGSMIKDQ